MNDKKQGLNLFSEKYTIFLSLFLFLLFILYFYNLGRIGLLDVDEPRYAEAGREMLESGNWIVPYFNYVVRFDKPVFFYWLEAISMKAFGINEFSVRLPSAILGIFTTCFILQFLRLIYGLNIALLCSVILMTSFEFAALSRFSVTDMTLCCFITCSIISFFQGYHEISTSHRFFKHQITLFSKWYILGFIFLALAILTKGPVALLLIGLVYLPFFWWIGKLEYFFKSNSFYIGCVALIIITFPWYLAVHVKTNGEFTKAFFGLHNIARYTSVVSGHKGSIFYFIPVLLIGFLPWTFFLFQAISSTLKNGLRNITASQKNQFRWFSLWWFLIIFIFFSFSKTKLLTYILPLFPAISILVAIWFDEISRSKFISKGLVIGLGIFFLFSITILYLCLTNLDVLLPREVKNLSLDFQIIVFSFLLLVGVSMAWSSSHKNIPLTFSILASTFLIVYFSLTTFLLPKIDLYSQFKLREFAKSMPKDVEIFTYQIIKPSLTFYSKRMISTTDSLEDVQQKLNSTSKVAFATKEKLLEGKTLSNAYKWGSDNKYIFYTNYPLNDSMPLK